jgi:hypothetical protein
MMKMVAMTISMTRGNGRQESDSQLEEKLVF